MRRFSYILAEITLSICLVGCGNAKDNASSAREEIQAEVPEQAEKTPEGTDEALEKTDEKPDETDETSKDVNEALDEIDEASEETDGVPEKVNEAPEETDETSEALNEASKEVTSTDGHAKGFFGDIMKTYFFNYTVHNAYLCEEYNGYMPSDGNCLLVAEVTVKNTYTETITMYDTDFQIQWNSDGADDYDYPITNHTAPVSDEQFEGSYELGINEEATGLLVYEVPREKNDFSISYLELFDDDSEGDVYFVYFTARMQ